MNFRIAGHLLKWTVLSSCAAWIMIVQWFIYWLFNLKAIQNAENGHLKPRAISNVVSFHWNNRTNVQQIHDAKKIILLIYKTNSKVIKYSETKWIECNGIECIKYTCFLYALTHPLQYGQFLCSHPNWPFPCTLSIVRVSMIKVSESLPIQWEIEILEGTMISRHTGV